LTKKWKATPTFYNNHFPDNGIDAGKSTVLGTLFSGATIGSGVAKVYTLSFKHTLFTGKWMLLEEYQEVPDP
jgi:hypothetical protein